MSTLLIDYELTLEQMIAMKDYDWKNHHITRENFPIIGDGKDEYEFELVHPNRDISTADAHKETANGSDPDNPWVDAKFEHILACVKDLSCRKAETFTIVALGSIVNINGTDRVLCIVSDGTQCGLDLCLYGYDWGSDCRFCRVRKKKVSVS